MKKEISMKHCKADIKNKIIRHVSDAFSEDPLRVLRVARFAALDVEFKVKKKH